MKKVWNIIAFLAVVNLLAVGGFVGWLGATDRLNAEVNRILQTEDMREKLNREGAEPYVLAPDQFGNVLLRVNQDGAKVRLKDVARIELAGENFDVGHIGAVAAPKINCDEEVLRRELALRAPGAEKQRRVVRARLARVAVVRVDRALALGDTRNLDPHARRGGVEAALHPEVEEVAGVVGQAEVAAVRAHSSGSAE